MSVFSVDLLKPFDILFIFMVLRAEEALVKLRLNQTRRNKYYALQYFTEANHLFIFELR